MAIRGYRYYMGVHMGICRGPVDSIVEMRVGDRTVFPLPAVTTDPDTGLPVEGATPGPVETSSTVTLNAPNLFGGDEKEGGIAGNIDVMMGEVSQGVNARLATMLGGNLISAFRGVLTMYYDGLIATLSPYPKPWKFRLRRILKGWDGDVFEPTLALVSITVTQPLVAGGPPVAQEIQAMNPAHIIYECVTNRDWGRGLSATLLDATTFTESATKLHTEGFGLCIKWTREDTVEAFVQNVLDHIGGVLYVDRTTGLLCLSLMRDDYDVDTLPVYTTLTGILTVDEDSTSTKQTAINEIVVKFTDPLTGKDRQMRVQNIASVQAAGSILSKSVEYLGVPSADLASRLAQRDLRVASAQLRRFKIVFDRSAYRLHPGSVFILKDTARKFAQLVLRVGKVEDSAADGRITITALQDVFGLAQTSFVASQPGGGTGIVGAIDPPYATAVEASYIDLRRILSAADFGALNPEATYMMTMGAQPSSNSVGYTLWGGTDLLGYTTKGLANWTSAAVMLNRISRTDTLLALRDLGIPQPVVVGSGVQVDGEVMRVDAFNATTLTLTVARGCGDTVPQEHKSGSPVFFYTSEVGFDTYPYVESDVVYGALLTKTTSSELLAASATKYRVDMVGRPIRPYPPAKVRLGGVPIYEAIPPTAFAPVDSLYGSNSLLLHFNDTDLSDSSPRQKLISVVGGVSRSAVQSKFGGYSALFDGSTGHLSTPHHTDFSIVGVDFTLEAWVYRAASGSEDYILSKRHNTTVGDFDGWEWRINATNLVQFFFVSGTGVISSATVPSGQWVYLSVVRSGSTMTIYIDGVSVGSATILSGSDNTSDPLRIGTAPDLSTHFNGYIDDIRITKGVARDPGVPVVEFYEQGGADTQFPSVRLLHRCESLADSSSFGNNLTSIAGGAVSTAQAKFGAASLQVGASAGNFSIPGNVFALGNENFTVECWVYLTAYPSVNACVMGGFASGDMGFELLISDTGRPFFRASVGGTTDDGIYISGPAGTLIALNTWTHIAAVGAGDKKRMYTSGVGGSIVTDSRVYRTPTTAKLGINGDAVWQMEGYIDEIRVTAGNARYLSDFTPPTDRFPDATPATIWAGLTIDWVARNRVSQHGVLLSHDDSTVTPEAGQTHSIMLTSATGVIRTESIPSANTWVYDSAAWTSDGNPDPVQVKLVSVRDGHESWKSYERQFCFNPASTGSHAYWRILFTEIYVPAAGTSGVCGIFINEVQMRATYGGTNQCIGGLASASSDLATYSFLAGAAFDGSSVDQVPWISATRTASAVSDWLQYHFVTPVIVKEVAITINTPNYPTANPEYPRAFKVQFSDDGVSWSTAFFSREVPTSGWGPVARVFSQIKVV